MVMSTTIVCSTKSGAYLESEIKCIMEYVYSIPLAPDVNINCCFSLALKATRLENIVFLRYQVNISWV